MGLLIEALFSIALIIAVIWAISLWRSGARDKSAAAAEAEEARRAAELDEALARPGQSLHCLNCDTHFKGPLPDTGCPNCHLSTLVVPESQDSPTEPQKIKRSRR